MNPVAQRIAIAEAVGWVWKEIDGKPGFFSWHRPGGGWTRTYLFLEQCRTKEQEAETELPKYTTDLNLMYEVEEWDFDNLERYYINLDTLMGKGRCFKVSEADHLKVFRATAAQRAEAFLRTIGQWRAAP